MREFAFTLQFDAGEDPLTDCFATHEDASSQALVCALSDDRLWGLEQVSGPVDALGDIKPLLLDPARGFESISETPCEATWSHDLLDDRRNQCTVYSLVEGTERCHTVPSLANRYLPLGTLCRVRRHGRCQHWRVLTSNERRVGLLFETLHEKLRAGVTFRFDHLMDATWAGEILLSATLPANQQAALESAIEHGYYETPRDVTLDELAATLGLPRSTLSYRLRKAEARLAKEYADNTP
ncbi:HTH DNA binding domain-containing protein [Halogranum amylolyticum]|uniref:HTH DNA binding domain-containing protein n=2 Tax=Halogranum amylolyticum TaxID=660520 RepID=A0A1H8PH55_9EURY|nr:HTH DNA binding domain-containing protein [Halogranum amylolyticum]